MRDGAFVREEVRDLLDVTRTPHEREGDLASQIAANNVGIKRINSVVREHHSEQVRKTFDDLRLYSRRLMLTELTKYAGAKGNFIDYMESDGAGNWDIPISVEIAFGEESVRVSFEGTAEKLTEISIAQ